MRPRLGAGCAVVLWLCCASPARAAAPTPVLFPSPSTPLTAQPPVGDRNAAIPQHIPVGRIAASTRVVAELDARGAPIAVTAVQRLTIHGVGDYFFAIPAPVKDVLSGPGTESEPGLRPGMVLWQGFSGGNRVLAARLVFEPGRVVPVLPLRLRLSRDGSLVTLELENKTRTRVSSFTAVVGSGESRRYLDALERFAAGGRAPSPYVNAKDIRGVERTVVAPLRVTGALVFPSGRRVGVDLVLGAAGRSVRVAAAPPGRPKLELVVHPIPFGSRAPARPTFDEVMARALSLARARQYETFLSNPDAAGPTRTSYVFRSAAERPALQVESQPAKDSPWPEVLLGCGFAVVLVAGIVAWAHS